MKKIPTAYIREYENHKIINIKNEYTNEKCKEAVEKGIPTLKIDGSCCAIINGELYKRYDCKKGRNAPEGAIPCCEPDEITGHHPHWVKCKEDDPADKWFFAACQNVLEHNFKNPEKYRMPDHTYEAIGPHFQGNPYNLEKDFLSMHGTQEIILKDRTFETIKEYLSENYIEGIVFWLDDEPVCKIKRSDFGFEWNGKGGR